MIESTCRECGEKALLRDSFWDDESKRFMRWFECPDCGAAFKQTGKANHKPIGKKVDELDLIRRVNKRLNELGGEDDE